MDNKNGEHIDEAVRLWRQAHASLEQQDVVVYLERAMRFHEFMVDHGLLQDNVAKARIRDQSKIFDNVTFLYRLPSVASYISRGSEVGADIATQASTVKMLHNEFLEYSCQQKFDNHETVSTLACDKRIAQNILLFCAKQKLLSQLNRLSKDHDILMAKLDHCKSCEEVMLLFKEKFGSKHAQVYVEICKMSHKAFVIEHADYNGYQKLNESPQFNQVILSEDEGFLINMRHLLAEHRLQGVLEEFSNQVPSDPPHKLKCFICEVLRNNDFQLSQTMKNLPVALLTSMKQIIDSQVVSLKTESRRSLKSTINYLTQRHFQEASALSKVSSELSQLIQERQPRCANNK